MSIEQIANGEIGSSVRAKLNQIIDAVNDLVFRRDNSHFLAAGMVIHWPAHYLPDGFLWCNGDLVDRATYLDLYAVLDTTYGFGDETNFRLPDYRGMVLVGRDDMGGIAAGIITAGGSGLDGTQLGSSAGVQSFVMSVDQMPSHTHDEHTYGFEVSQDNLSSGSVPRSGNVITQTGSAGGNSPIPLIQPSTICNFIIKT